MLVHAFKAYLAQVGYRAGTVRMLSRCVADFLSYGGVDAAEAGRAEIQAYYSWLQQRPLHRGGGVLSGRMIGHCLYALRVFYHWMAETGRVSGSPVSGLRWQQLGRTPPLPLTVDQVGALLEAAQTLKEQAALHLFYSCGLRRSEAVNLRIGDISVQQTCLYVRSGKGGRRRVVPLTRGVLSVLTGYVEQERSVGVTAGMRDSYMLNSGGRAMRGANYMRLVTVLAARAGIGPVTLHQLRRSIATHLLGRGMQLEQVRVFLGHRHLETTQLYAQADGTKVVAL